MRNQEGRGGSMGGKPRHSESHSFTHFFMAILLKVYLTSSVNTKKASKHPYTINSIKNSSFDPWIILKIPKTNFSEVRHGSFPENIWIFPLARVKFGGHSLGSRRQIYMLFGSNNSFPQFPKSCDDKTGGTSDTTSLLGRIQQVPLHNIDVHT